MEVEPQIAAPAEEPQGEKRRDISSHSGSPGAEPDNKRQANSEATMNLIAAVEANEDQEEKSRLNPMMEQQWAEAPSGAELREARFA